MKIALIVADIIAAISMIALIVFVFIYKEHNTTDMGRDLCDRITILEFHLKEDVALTDCDVIYD